MSFDGWLDARDGETLAREWATLGATRTEIGTHPRFVLGIQPEGAALLAAAWLGCSPERFAWFTVERLDDDDQAITRTWPAPVFAVRRPVTRCVLDAAIDVTEPDLDEDWKIREVREGARGVQLITLRYTYGPMTREGGNGGNATVVRLFDRSTGQGVSIRLHAREVYTIGRPVDLSPLDLFAHRAGYRLRWRSLELAAARAFVAQITAELDAHFDTSAAWGGGVTRDEVLVNAPYNIRSRRRELVFQAGSYAIELGENLDPDVPDDPSSMFWIVVRGLPWGHSVNIRIALSRQPDGPVDGWIDFTLPLAQLVAAVARAAKIPEIELQL